MKCPYSVLGIPKDSSDSEIKKAYRELAKKHHPDKGGSEETFKEVNDAYKQLTDPEPELDLGDIFRMFSGTVLKGPDVFTSLEITLEELQRGGTFIVKYSRNIPTGEFNTVEMNTPFGVFSVMEPNEKNVVYETTIDIPKCYNRETITFRRHARAEGVPDSDLEVKIILKKHPVYTLVRSTMDLKMTLTITLKEALIGFDKNIFLLDSKEATKLECRSIVGPYDTKRLSGYGMNSGTSKGDLIISFKIIFPFELSDSVKDTLSSMELD